MRLVAVPPLPVAGMSRQVTSRLVEGVVELGVEMVGLQVDEGEHGGDGRREAAEGVIEILGLQGDALAEFLVVRLSGGADGAGVFPGAGGIGVVGADGAELPPSDGINGGQHV